MQVFQINTQPLRWSEWDGLYFGDLLDELVFRGNLIIKPCSPWYIAEQLRRQIEKSDCAANRETPVVRSVPLKG
jgi:hypothetical protein